MLRLFAERFAEVVQEEELGRDQNFEQMVTISFPKSVREPWDANLGDEDFLLLPSSLLGHLNGLNLAHGSFRAEITIFNCFIDAVTLLIVEFRLSAPHAVQALAQLILYDLHQTLV